VERTGHGPSQGDQQAGQKLAAERACPAHFNTPAFPQRSALFRGASWRKGAGTSENTSSPVCIFSIGPAAGVVEGEQIKSH
jgi:hypothetical protein